MDCVYIKWGMEATNGEGRNASLVELRDLQRLRALHLYVLDASVLPQDMFVRGKLKRYNIIVGSRIYGRLRISSRLLHLKLNQRSQVYYYGFQMLIEEAEVLYLGALPGVSNVVYQLDADGFPQLKRLNVEINDEVRYIVESTGEIQPYSAFQNLETLQLSSLQNLERICRGRFTAESFGKLRSISARSCDQLKNALSYTVARRLEEIIVEDCSVMEEIVYCESEDLTATCDEIEFSVLRSLTLKNLPNLIQFFHSELGTTNCHASSPVTPSMPLFNEKVAFPSLEILSLHRMDFSELWPNGLPSISFMQNLKTLFIWDCQRLKYLFPFAIVESLTQLEHLSVTNCQIIEEIIKEWPGSSRKILLPKLRSLYLQRLQSLKQFCGGDCDIECESLLEINIRKCPQLKSFTSTEIGGPLFTEKEIEFPRLQKLNVVGCESLKHLLSYEMARSLFQLQSLKVDSCSNMEEVVLVKEADEVQSLTEILFPKLKYLALSHLWILKRFSSADCVQCFPSVIKLNIHNGPDQRFQLGPTDFSEKVAAFNILSNMMFRNLKELTIKGRNCLPFTATESLQQLKKLTVSRCNVMEHVITKAIGEDGKLKKISFLKLESLYLHSLPELKSFCEGADYIECPSLLKLNISNCEKLRTFIPGSASTPTLTADEREVEVRESASQQSLFNEKVVFTNLEELYIGYSGHVANCEVWPRQSSTILFPKLKVLRLQGGVSGPGVSLFDIHRHENLERNVLRLRGDVSGSGVSLFNIHRHENLESISLLGFNVENIWHHGELGDAEEHGNKTLQRLRQLKLINLPKLMRLFDNAENIQLKPQTFQTLETLFVRECERLETLAMSSYFSFKNLTDVEISHCYGMIDLFDSSTAKSLVQLTRMKIEQCSRMRQVLRTDKEDEAETGIVFRRLRFLAFRRLPSLESFHCGNGELDFPNLGKIIVSECPKMSRFSHGTINTPNLKNIITKVDAFFWEGGYFGSLEEAKPIEKLILEGDLNRSIRKLWKQKETEDI